MGGESGVNPRVVRRIKLPSNELVLVVSVRRQIRPRSFHYRQYRFDQRRGVLRHHTFFLGDASPAGHARSAARPLPAGARITTPSPTWTRRASAPSRRPTISGTGAVRRPRDSWASALAPRLSPKARGPRELRSRPCMAEATVIAAPLVGLGGRRGLRERGRLLSRRVQLAQRRAQWIEARRHRIPIGFDKAPDCRSYCSELVVGEANCRHVSSPPEPHCSARAPSGVDDAPGRPLPTPRRRHLALVERLRLGVGANDPLGPELDEDGPRAPPRA